MTKTKTTGLVCEFVQLPTESLWSSGFLVAHGKTFEQMKKNTIMEFCESPSSLARVRMNIQSLPPSVRQVVSDKLSEIIQRR